jgi:hypothetical protein
MTFPVVDREPVPLPTLAGHDGELWEPLIELSEVRQGEWWTLIGGQMVFLHATEQGGIGPDPTTPPPGRTLQVPGGTQVLDRAELLPVVTSNRAGQVPWPSLLGAVVGRAMAVEVDDVPGLDGQIGSPCLSRRAS